MPLPTPTGLNREFHRERRKNAATSNLPLLVANPEE